MVAVSEVEGSETGSGRQKSVEKRNWFRLPGKYRKEELVPVMPGKWKSGTGSGCAGKVGKRNWFRLCRESRKAELVPVTKKV